MSCTAPIDLKTVGAAACQLKCFYWFKYGESSCTVRNGGTYLSIKYDGTSDVVFSNIKYTANELRIYKPSLHTFNGKQAEGELVLVHASTHDNLYVCIPLTTAGVYTSASAMLETIVNDAPLPSDGAVTLSVPNFNASTLIPKSAFFTYTGTSPLGDCGSDNHLLVFPMLAAINVPKDAMKSLGNSIAFSLINAVPGTCYYNEKGTASNGFAGDGQIYIACQPTGEADEITHQSTQNTSDKTDYSGLYGVFIMLGAIVAGFVFYRVLAMAFANKGNVLKAPAGV